MERRKSKKSNGKGIKHASMDGNSRPWTDIEYKALKDRIHSSTCKTHVRYTLFRQLLNSKLMITQLNIMN